MDINSQINSLMVKKSPKKKKKLSPTTQNYMNYLNKGKNEKNETKINSKKIKLKRKSPKGKLFKNKEK